MMQEGFGTLKIFHDQFSFFIFFVILDKIFGNLSGGIISFI